MRRVVQLVCILGSAAVFSFHVPAQSQSSYDSHTCVIAAVQLVAVSQSGEPRVAVRCNASTNGGIQWFSFRTADDPDHARMLLSMLTAAKIAGRTIKLGFDPMDTTGMTWGCGYDCRPMLQVIME